MEAVILLLALLGQPPPQAHGHTKLHHRTYHGGKVHEAETDGITDGIVIWKNGTMQEIHNGKLGKWFPVHPKQEGQPIKPPDEAVPDAPLVAADAGTAIIDDYVLISPRLVTYWGGMTSAINKAHVAVDRMNESFTNSGVNAQTRIVGVVQDSVDELDSTFDTLLNDLHSRFSAGAFNAARAANGFDIISKLVYTNQYCGLGFLFASSGTYGQQVINGDCAGPNVSLAHEIGHNMGLNHNVGNQGAAIAGCGATAVGYGETRFRTVMSYPTPVINGVQQNYGGRTPQYSAKPPATWAQDHTSPVGTTQTDAAGCLKITTPIVAGFHAAVIPTSPNRPSTPVSVTVTP